VWPIELTSRQSDIVNLVKQHNPITGEQIAQMLGLSRQTIRTDLSVLVMLGCLDAKPKVGYFLGASAQGTGSLRQRLAELTVRHVQSQPVIVRETTMVNDAVVTMILEDAGTLIVADEDNCLLGVVSRKDILKLSLGSVGGYTVPVAVAMTRVPHVVTATPDDSVLDAAHRMIHYQVNSLPVVRRPDGANGRGALEVVGRVTETTMTRLLVELGTGV